MLFRNVQFCFDFVERTKFRSTLLPKAAKLLPKTATMSKQHWTLSKGRNFTIESFDIVAVCGNKVECCFDKVERCFDIVAGVDGALRVVDGSRENATLRFIDKVAVSARWAVSSGDVKSAALWTTPGQSATTAALRRPRHTPRSVFTSAINVTSVQSNPAKGRIAVLLPYCGTDAAWRLDDMTRFLMKLLGHPVLTL